jgi:hypothetical protein
METKYKIAIPKPCDEDWNKMTPEQSGRFCGSCAKSVVDFTQMNETEIQSYFVINQNKNVCGRFKNVQLDTIIIKIPSKVLYAQVHFHKIFFLALLVSMGTTLFSCADKNGNKQKIDGVEVVDDGTKVDYMTTGAPRFSSDTLQSVQNKPKTDEVKKIDSKKGEVAIVEEDYNNVTAGMVLPTVVDEQIKDSVK